MRSFKAVSLSCVSSDSGEVAFSTVSLLRPVKKKKGTPYIKQTKVPLLLFCQHVDGKLPHTKLLTYHRKMPLSVCYMQLEDLGIFKHNIPFVVLLASSLGSSILGLS